MQIAIQIIGFIGALLAIISFQSNRHGVIMALKTASETVFAVQLMLLGAYTGVAMNIIGSVRNLIFAALVKKGKSTTPWIIVFSVLTVVFGVLTWAGPISLLAIAGKLITTVAYGMKNPSGVRLLTIPSCLCWGVYNALNFSLAGICTEAFSLASIIAGEVRYRKLRKTGMLSGKKENVVNAPAKENKAF